MNAAATLAHLRARLHAEQIALDGIVGARDEANRQHAEYLAMAKAIEERRRHEIDLLRAQLPEAEAAAEEESRLASLATAQQELDDLMEVERAEAARRSRVEEVRGQIRELDGQAVSS